MTLEAFTAAASTLDFDVRFAEAQPRGGWARPINVREQFDKFAAGVRWVRVSG